MTIRSGTLLFPAIGLEQNSGSLEVASGARVLTPRSEIGIQRGVLGGSGFVKPATVSGILQGQLLLDRLSIESPNGTFHCDIRGRANGDFDKSDRRRAFPRWNLAG